MAAETATAGGGAGIFRSAAATHGPGTAAHIDLYYADGCERPRVPKTVEAHPPSTPRVDEPNRGSRAPSVPVVRPEPVHEPTRIPTPPPPRDEPKRENPRPPSAPVAGPAPQNTR